MLLKGFGILTVFFFCASVRMWFGRKGGFGGGRDRGKRGEEGGEAIPGQFSTSGIYESWRYAVMQQGILQLTKRPLVQHDSLFLPQPVAQYSGQYTDGAGAFGGFMGHLLEGREIFFKYKKKKTFSEVISKRDLY